MRVETELMRGAGPVAVLKLLERGEMYGYELVEALAARTGGVLDMGQSTLYPLLYNLEAKGLIASRWEEKESGSSAGRPRKYYALTRKGKARLAKDAAQWGALIGAMQALGVLPDATISRRALALRAVFSGFSHCATPRRIGVACLAPSPVASTGEGGVRATGFASLHLRFANESSLRRGLMGDLA